jgi:UDP-glucose 4-epimerase
MDCLAQRGLQALGVSRRRFPNVLQVDSYEDVPSGDVLVHMAEASDRAYAQAHAPSYEQRAMATLERLQVKGFARVIYASSAVLYGDQEHSPRKVGDPVYETDAYTRLKLASERAVLASNGVVARLANLYGPGMAEGNVISTILGQIQQEGPVRVFDATPVRDFLWVEDAARALADMATGGACGIFNVGSGQGVSIHELATEVLTAAGQADRRIESIHAGTRFSKLVLDIVQTREAFGWQPIVTLAEGVANLVKSKIARE